MNTVSFTRQNDFITVRVHERLSHAVGIVADTTVTATVHSGALVISSKPDKGGFPVKVVRCQSYGLSLQIPYRLAYACFIGPRDRKVDLHMNNYGDLVLRVVREDPVKKAMSDMVRGKITPELAAMINRNKSRLH